MFYFYFTEYLAIDLSKGVPGGLVLEQSVLSTNLSVYGEQCVTSEKQQTVLWTKRYTDPSVYGEQCVTSDVRQTTTAVGWIKEEYRTYTTCSYNIRRTTTCGALYLFTAL